MSRIADLTNQERGFWTIISMRRHEKRGHIQWLCRCRCGTEKYLSVSLLNSGKTSSCGCFSADQARKRLTTHGLAKTQEYKILMGIIKRCEDKNHPSYMKYGARGVTVCERWRNSPADFIADLGYRPSSSHSIERRDGKKGYEPENCYWATSLQQGGNTTRVRRIEFRNEVHSLLQWSKILGFSYGGVKARLDSGWPLEMAFLTPVDSRRGKRPLRQVITEFLKGPETLGLPQASVSTTMVPNLQDESQRVSAPVSLVSAVK